ncbi:hypothetical protein QE152_g7407 [Popillia japonica]|uniref:Uncharacterized protein n=1 Tax=Popillia japonica TaxID=7064 RepID=A0AAW1MB94_POPJA
MITIPCQKEETREEDWEEGYEDLHKDGRTSIVCAEKEETRKEDWKECQKEETREEDWEEAYEDLHKEERTPVVCAEIPSDQLKFVKSIEYGSQPVLAKQKEILVKSVEYGGQPVLAQQKEMITIPCQKEETREEDWEGGDEDLHKEERTPVVCAELPSDQLKLVKSVEYGGQPVLAQQKEIKEERTPVVCAEVPSDQLKLVKSIEYDGQPVLAQQKEIVTIPCQKEKTKEEDWGEGYEDLNKEERTPVVCAEVPSDQLKLVKEEDWEEGYEDLHKDERTSIVCAEVPSDQLKFVKSIEYGGQPVLAQQKEMITIPCQKEETREEDWEEGYEDLHKDGRTSIVCAEVPSNQLKLVKSVEYGGQPNLAQ